MLHDWWRLGDMVRDSWCGVVSKRTDLGHHAAFQRSGLREKGTAERAFSAKRCSGRHRGAVEHFLAQVVAWIIE
jgi:hypothetical protein